MSNPAHVLGEPLYPQAMEVDTDNLRAEFSASSCGHLRHALADRCGVFVWISEDLYGARGHAKLSEGRSLSGQSIGKLSSYSYMAIPPRLVARGSTTGPVRKMQTNIRGRTDAQDYPAATA